MFIQRSLGANHCYYRFYAAEVVVALEYLHCQGWDSFLVLVVF